MVSFAGQTATQLKIDGQEIRVNVAETAVQRAVWTLAQCDDSNTGRRLGAASSGCRGQYGAYTQSINRLNQSRTVTITGGTDETVSTAQMSAAVQAVMDTFPLPEGISYESGGEMQEMIETFVRLAYALVVALGLVYFVLPSQLSPLSCRSSS